MVRLVIALFFALPLHAMLFPTITSQLIARYLEEKRRPEADYDPKVVSVQELPREEPFDAMVQRLSGWMEFDCGKVSQAERFAKLKGYLADDAVKRSMFNHAWTLPCPPKSVGTFLRLNLNSNVYFSLGVSNLTQKKKRFKGDNTQEIKEYFSFLETGFLEGALSLAAWHQDALKEKKIPEGYGFVTSFQPKLAGAFAPFLRLSFVEGKCFDISRSVSLGVGYEAPFERQEDYFGVGATWGHPDKGRDQTTFETYYKYQTGIGVTVTPHLQVHYHPIKNQDNVAEATLGVSFKSKF